MIGLCNTEENEIVAPPNPVASLCFFGAGTLLEACFDQLVLAAGRRPDALCDNSREKWGKTFFGIPCVSPESIPGAPENAIVVICIRNYEAAYAQLVSLGYSHIYLANFDRGYHRISGLQQLPGNQQKLPTPLQMSLEGHWALVTGASRGIGQQIAQALAQQGINLICHGKTMHSAELACNAIQQQKITTIPVSADLSDPDELEEFCSWLSNSAPPVSILYNNAGISPACSEGFWNAPLQDFTKSYAVNAITPIRLCQTLVPKMKDREFGRVINVSSSIQHRPDQMAYACSKAALDKFVFDIAPYLSGSGVMISQLDPGWLRTDMGGKDAPHDVDSVLPGALLGALINGDVNGRWFSAQDYRGLTLEGAILKAFFIGACTSQPSAAQSDI